MGWQEDNIIVLARVEAVEPVWGEGAHGQWRRVNENQGGANFKRSYCSY
jgi:hypothetical protein